MKVLQGNILEAQNVYSDGIDVLKEKKQFHEFKFACDDIRNYFLRKIIIEEDRRFDWADILTVDELAGNIYRHLTTGENKFKTLLKLDSINAFTAAVAVTRL